MIKKYLKKLAQYPRLRIVLIIVVVIVVIIVLFDLFAPSAPKKTAPPIGGSSIQTGNLKQAAHETQIGSKKYQTEAEKLKQQKANQKTESGATVLSGVFDQAEKTSGASSAAAAKSPTAEAKSPSEIVQEQQAAQHPTHSSVSESPSTYLKYHQNTASARTVSVGGQYAQVNTQAEGSLQSAMLSKVESYQDEWKLPTQSNVEGSAANSNGAGGSGLNGSGAGGASGNNAIMIKAGSILFAVLDNSLNSDISGSPVMATIVTGKYRGAKLLGTFSRGGYDSEALVLRFSRMVLKSQDSSIGINAVAVSPKTAEAALASTVNHHYLTRFGSLFAAAFLQGFGNSYANYQNPCVGTNNCFVDGNIQRPSVTTKTAIYQGLGQIGTNAASIVGQNFNRPVTVTLKQGTAMGILFTDAVTNTPPKKAQPASYQPRNRYGVNQGLNQFGSAIGQALGHVGQQYQAGLSNQAYNSGQAPFGGGSNYQQQPQQQQSQPQQQPQQQQPQQPPRF